MNKGIIIFFFLIFILNFTSANCTEGQVNINLASLEDLDSIYGIGPAKAQAIINARPFSSLDDLIRVSGIGEIVLQDILAQGLACLDSDNYSEQSSEEQKNISNEIIEETNEEPSESSPIKNSIKEEQSKEIIYIQEKKKEIEPIFLTPKDIKTPKNSKIQDETKYAWYALIIFCVFLAVFIAFEKNRKGKNEFRTN